MFFCILHKIENPVRTYHHITPTHQVVPQETVYKSQATHLSHAQIPLHHQQPEQQVPSLFFSTQTIAQQQVSPQSFTTQSYSPLSTHTTTSHISQASPLQAHHVPSDNAAPRPFIPPAPPLLPNFNVRPNYSDQQVKIINGGLQDQPLYVGSDTVFECQFNGQPDRIQWFRNEIEITFNPQNLENR